MDADELELFAHTVRRATEAHTGPALDGALEALGWPTALAEDPRAAVAVLFAHQGAAGVTSSALDQVFGRRLARGLAPERGPDTAGTVLPRVGRRQAPGELQGDRLMVRGVGTSSLADRPAALVVAASGDEHVALDVATADLTLRRVQGMDPQLGLIEVVGDDVAHGPVLPLAPDTWADAVALAQLAVGHELVGAARTMLELARSHALGRVQFGRPIATFQAVRHRLADTLVAIESADAVLGAAWEDGDARTASVAKALAGRGARTAARHSQQVLAGIGFTTEHTLHRYVRRVLVLDELFGASRHLTAALGDELLATRRLPALSPL